MFYAGEVPVAPDLNSLMPPWAQQLSLLTLLVLIIVAWMRGWILTSAEAERRVTAERRVSDIWESNFTKSTDINARLTDALQPVLTSNEAILKAVTEVQEEQRRYRERGPRREY